MTGPTASKLRTQLTRDAATGIPTTSHRTTLLTLAVVAMESEKSALVEKRAVIFTVKEDFLYDQYPPLICTIATKRSVINSQIKQETVVVLHFYRK